MYTGLRSITEFVEYYGTGGGLCRPIFAEFLDEAEGAGRPEARGPLGALRRAGAGLERAGGRGAARRGPEFKKTKELIADGLDTVGPEALQCGKALEESQ